MLHQQRHVAANSDLLSNEWIPASALRLHILKLESLAAGFEASLAAQILDLITDSSVYGGSSASTLGTPAVYDICLSTTSQIDEQYIGEAMFSYDARSLQLTATLRSTVSSSYCYVLTGRVNSETLNVTLRDARNGRQIYELNSVNLQNRSSRSGQFELAATALAPNEEGQPAVIELTLTFNNRRWRLS